MEKKFRILYVDDSPFDREMVRHALDREKNAFEVVMAADRAAFEELLSMGPWDLVLSDFHIAEYHGFQVLEAVHALDPGIPVVIVTGTGSEEIAAEAMKRGASDYVLKTASHLQRLPMTIRAAMEHRRLAADRGQSISELVATFEATADGILVVDNAGQLVRFNARFRDLWSVPEDLLAAKDLEALLDFAKDQLADPGAFLSMARASYLSDASTFDILEFQDGRVVERHSEPQMLEGKKIGRVVNFRDVSEKVRAERDLKKSLSLLQATLESTADGILVVGQQRQVVGANRKFQELWRIPDELMDSRDDARLLGFVLDQLVDPEAFLKVVESLYVRERETSADVLHFKDGRVFDRYSQPQYVDGAPVGRVWSFRDITEQRTQAQAILRMTQLYAALSQINQAIVRVKTQEDLFAEICEALVAFGKFKVAWIGRNEPAQATVSVLSQYGDTDDFQSGVTIRSDDSPEGRGPTGKAIREGQPCVVNDFLNSPEAGPWRASATRCGFKAAGAFPIRLGGQVWGALSVYAADQNFFGTQEIELLVETATDISFALDFLEGEERRKQAEEALRSFFDGAPFQMGISELTTDEDVILVSVNAAAAASMGLTPEATQGKRISELGLAGAGKGVWVDQYRETLRTRQPVHFEQPNPFAGSEGWWGVTLAYVGEGPTGLPRFSYVVEDITEQRRLAEALREQESTIRAFYDGSPLMMGVVELTPGDDIIAVSVNEATARRFHRTAAEVLKLSAPEAGIGEEERSIWLARYREAETTGHPVRFELSGNWLHRRTSLSVVVSLIGRTPEGNPRLCFISQDITETKLVELALQEREATLAQAVEALRRQNELHQLVQRATKDAIWDWDLVSDAAQWNESTQEVFGYSAEEIMSDLHWWQNNIHPEDQGRVLAGLMGVIEGGGIFWSDDYRLRKGNGAYAFVLDRGYVVRDGQGKPVRMIGALADLTERKRAEQAQEAQRNISEAAHLTATLPELFGRIHEIIGELLPARNFFVALYDESLDELTFPYFVDEYDSTPESRSLSDGTLSGQVIRRGEALLLTRETRQERSNQELPVAGSESLDWLGVPLKSRTGTIGALVVQSYSGDIRYTDKDKALLEFVSGQVASAIERKQAEEALRLSESRLEEAQRLAHLGSYNWDLATRTLSWSDELCRLYGVDPGTHVPTFEDFLHRVHPEDRARVEAQVAQALADLKPFNYELRILRPDGEVRTLFDQSEVHIGEQGRVTGITGACLDITARKLEELLDQDRTLILEQVAQNQPLHGILSHIANMVVAQIPKSRSSILLLKDGRLWNGASPHLPAAYSESLEGLPIGPATGSCGTACYRGETVITEDIATDPLWDGYRELALPHGMRACWSMPIPSSEGGVLGALAIYRDEPCRPSTQELDSLGMATRLAAVAIEHRLLTDQLSHQAQHDALTGLPNRVLFQDRLSQALAQAQRKRHQVAVLYMDLDRFKLINDTLGHSSGDALLRQAALRLDECIRKSDTLARLGGDEFTVVLTELRDSQDAMRVAKKLIEAMRVPFQVEGRELFVSVSLGLSIYPDDGMDGETLMANADVAMYRAKDMGRDNFQWFASEMNALAKERMDLESQLRHAMELGQLSLHYQPQCGAKGEIQGFEALMRWQHPILGMVSPARFIPLAEESGLIVQMGDWALREACAQTVAWRKAGHPALRMSVNVSAVQFKRADWVDSVRRALSDTRLAPKALELEITESLLLQSVKETSANLFELRELGVGVAIDDFGTGYSSLSYLHKLPVTTLKIDQSFVREIGINPVEGREEAPIVRTIIALAHNLGMTVVAEGVETEVQRELLLCLGCESLQGYLLHRPLTVEQAEILLNAIAEKPRPRTKKATAKPKVAKPKSAKAMAAKAKAARPAAKKR